MAINQRDRIPRMTQTHVGSLEGCLHFWPGEFATPGGIRHAYHKPLVGFEAEREEATGMMQATCSSRVGWVMNIASMYSELVLPNCQQVLHLPIVMPGYVQCDLMVLFWAMPKQLAILISSERVATEWEAEASPLGARL